MSAAPAQALVDAPQSSSATDGGPLTPEHQRALAEANQRVRKVMAAGKMAAFNGWTSGIFAALTLPFALFSLTALVVGAALALVAWNEFRGRKLLLHFDGRGPRVLGWNQLGFMTLLIGYGLWGIYSALTGPNPYADQIKAMPELEQMLGPIDEMHLILAVAVYGCLIVFSAIFQGLNALYYFTRRKHLDAYLVRTPLWIVDLQKFSAGGGE